MPGPRDTYSARTADLHVPYSDEHPWCGLDIFLPAFDVPIVGVYAWNRGGGNISEPSIWDRWGYDPDANVGEGGDLIDAFLEAGVAFVRVEYPNGPQPIHTSRHHPTVREPHNWMFCQRAFQFMQTHALDGLLTGSRLRAFPVDYRGYFFGGPSAGALNAGMVALSPSGHVPYDNLFFRNAGYYAVRSDGRIRGAWMEDLPSEFMLYGREISANAMPFFGDTGRVQGPDANNQAIVRTTRMDTLSRELRRGIGMLQLAQLRADENRHVSLAIDNSVNAIEASYFGSGLTFQVSNYTGDPTGATTISLAADATKSATVKLIQQLTPTTIAVYAEPNASTYVRQWQGNLTLGAATVTGYIVSGNDARKTFLSRQAAVAEAKAANYGPFEDTITPHPVLAGGLIASEREDWLGSENRDRYFLGSAYPAQISGDSPRSVDTAGWNKPDQMLGWMASMGVDVEV